MDLELFTRDELICPKEEQPLAERFRPRQLEDVYGQDHLLAKGQFLRHLIDHDGLHSAIFYGPPGTGKTTLAQIIARTTKSHFENLSAVTANLPILREVCLKAERSRMQSKTLVFIDEIHRFNTAQQDFLLPYVEKGIISFLGATTHNPMLAVNGPLLSRSLVFRLKKLAESDFLRLFTRLYADREMGLGEHSVTWDRDAKLLLIKASDGDARRFLNWIEHIHGIAVQSQIFNVRPIDAQKVLDEKVILYDKNGDAHYDTISAFIKSVRGSDPDAAIYWLAKMLRSGEDFLFIARRLVILASEDIGNADPQALPLAVSTMQACQLIGLPEARIPLAQTTIYLALAPKSNASYQAIEKAGEYVLNEISQDVPDHLKNIHIKDQEKADYLYPHDYDGHFVAQNYMDRLVEFVDCSTMGFENELKKRLEAWKQLRKK